jgi:hypothetical protein
MGELTTPNKLPYPLDSDTPDVPRDIKALALGVEKALKATGVPTFADNAERDAAFADAGVSPSNGMLVWNESVQSYQRWWSGGSKWVYGWFGGYRTASVNAPLTPDQPYTVTYTQVEDLETANIEPLPFTPPGTQITLPVTGAYMIDAGAAIQVGGTAGNLRTSVIRTRGASAFEVGRTDVSANANAMSNVSRQVLFPFAAGDKISVTHTATVAGCVLNGAAVRIAHVGTP